MPDLTLRRTKIIQDVSALQFVVAAKPDAGRIVILTVWLMGWALGCFFAVGLFLTGTGPILWFVAFWGMVWIISGISVLSLVLWSSTGREVITLTHDTLTLERVQKGWRRNIKIPLTDISNLRYRATPTRMWGRSRHPTGLWAKWSTGTIVFANNKRTFGFAQDLNQTEADEIIRLILAQTNIAISGNSP